jgi:hypothetical protein
MHVLLTRRWFTEHSTIGTLDVDGAFVCHTLEDRVRRDDPTTVADEGQKVAGATAIPAGRYRVVLTESDRVIAGSLWSPRSDHKLPLLVDVRGFTGIRIHSGNTDRNTEGCILVGRGRAVDAITDSRVALTTLLEMIEAGIAAGGCEIEVVETGGLTA